MATLSISTLRLNLALSTHAAHPMELCLVCDEETKHIFTCMECREGRYMLCLSYHRRPSGASAADVGQHSTMARQHRATVARGGRHATMARQWRAVRSQESAKLWWAAMASTLIASGLLGCRAIYVAARLLSTVTNCLPKRSVLLMILSATCQ